MNCRQSQFEGVGAWSRRRADRRSSKEPHSVANKSCPTPESSSRLTSSTPTSSRKRSAPSSQNTGESKRTKRTSVIISSSSYNANTTTNSNTSIQDCVAHRTRSKSLNNTVDNPTSTPVLPYSLSKFRRLIVDAEPNTPQSSSFVQKATGHLEGSLFPLEDRDFNYSPFSASTATDIVDSDHSLYTPTRSKNKKRSRKSRSNVSVVNKKVRYNGLLQNRFAAASTTTGRLQAALQSEGSTSHLSNRGPVTRPSLIPRRVPSTVQNRTYPLRNRSANLLNSSEANLRDSSGEFFRIMCLNVYFFFFIS